jgi:hypothetical protein
VFQLRNTLSQLSLHIGRPRPIKITGTKLLLHYLRGFFELDQLALETLPVQVHELLLLAQAELCRDLLFNDFLQIDESDPVFHVNCYFLHGATDVFDICFCVELGSKIHWQALELPDSLVLRLKYMLYAFECQFDDITLIVPFRFSVQ